MSGSGTAQWALRLVLIELWRMQQAHVSLSHLAEFETLLNSDPIHRNRFSVGLIKSHKFCK
jgi:hypothetical protein